MRTWRFWIKNTNDPDGFWWTNSAYSLRAAWPVLSANEYVSEYEEN